MRILSVFIFWLSYAAIALAEDDTESGYRLGKGYALGDSGWRLGGYTSAKVSLSSQKPWQFEISDLSLFLSWDNGSRLRFFSELEVGDPLTAAEHRSLTGDNAHFEFERFYVDGLVNQQLTLRAGKFLTPIGQWNRIHAYPLVWTTFRPVATENLFSTHVSGLMAHGFINTTGSRALEYALYGDLSNSIDPHLSKSPFENAIGAYLRYPLTDNLYLGVSFSNFRLKNRQESRDYLVGFDAQWSYQKFELSSEVVYRASESKNGPNQWQGFVQSVNPLFSNWFAIGRYEFFEQPHDKAGYAGVLGLAYRPIPPLVWKMEYRLGEHNQVLAPDGFAASLSVLF